MKLWTTSRTRSALVNVTSAIFPTGMPWVGGCRHGHGDRRHRRSGTSRTRRGAPHLLAVATVMLVLRPPSAWEAVDVKQQSIGSIT
ncbi:hypothetical protein GTY73_01440 [Streptomyces sp. SID8354]|nr:hypothetical protein [Streptomyces sp. SID8354]